MQQRTTNPVTIRALACPLHAPLARAIPVAALVASAILSSRACGQSTTSDAGAVGPAASPAPVAPRAAASGSEASRASPSSSPTSSLGIANAPTSGAVSTPSQASASTAAPGALSGSSPAPAFTPVSIALGSLPDDDDFAPDAVIRTNSSLLALALSRPARYARQPVAPGTIEAMSLFAVRSPEERHFAKHDLVQIIVRESSRARSGQTLDTKKNYTLAGEVAWANFSFDAFGQPGVATTSGTHNAPVFEAIGKKRLKGEGDYDRTDEFVTRMTAEVIEVMPNGNLILEARTTISSDKEKSVIKLTGMCRPEDITSANTILSNQIHDLKIEKMNTGFVKDAADKGIIAQILDAIFAF